MPPESYGNLLQHFTGSKEHNVALREDAVRAGSPSPSTASRTSRRGETFTARGPRRSCTSTSATSSSRRSCARTRASSRAARHGELPKLVELGDLRGDLHTHTTWSADGKDTLEEMVARRARGYDYLAVTDHSHYLREGRLEAQCEEIEALHERRRPRSGSCAGSRSTSGRRLARRRRRAARAAGLGRWRRCTRASTRTRPSALAAMENPHVDCIGHLTGRKLNKRPPADVDVERVIEKALETGTFLEINSQPDRLDLRDVHARAGGRGRCARRQLDDAHETGRSTYVEIGIGQARRAWLTKADVLNTRPWTQIERISEAPTVDLRRAPRRRLGGRLPRAGARAARARAGGAGRDPLPAARRAAGRAEPFSAVLRLDEVLLDGVTHWQTPRFFAYFATTGSAEAGLAELLAATLN